jgi:hypothetical protein
VRDHPGQHAPALIALLAGLLPIFAVHAAWLLNLFDGTDLEPGYLCFPYIDGCVSVSRAVRSGPGLHLFRAVILPSAALLLFTWLLLPAWLRNLGIKPRSAITWLGAIGAVFLVVYSTWLGTEGAWYGWLRRYGVIFYFGGTALALLLLLNVLWRQRKSLLDGRLRTPIELLAVLVAWQWLAGVFAAIKRLIFSAPEFIDRLENITEWWFALPMSLSFVVLACLFYRSGFQLGFKLRR